MIKIYMKNKRTLYLRTPSRDIERAELYENLSRQFADKNTRAISVVLDEDAFGDKFRTILCEDIDHIGM